MQSIVANNNHGTVEAIKLLLQQLDPIQQAEIIATVSNQKLENPKSTLIRKPRKCSRKDRINELTKILVDQQNMNL